MTTVMYREYYDKYIISVEGHAGFASAGSDIICAAVSAVAQTLINALMQEHDDDRLCLRELQVNDGSVYIEVEPFDFSQERTSTIIETCMAGFNYLEEEFPDYVRIT